jgi:hypothetical protein
MSRRESTGTRPGSSGVTFPNVDGHRSTSRLGRSVLADAAGEVDTALAGEILAEREWRSRYPTHLRALVAAELRAGTAAAPVAHAGVDSLHRRMTFVRDDGERPLADAMAEPETALGTVTIHGHGPPRREVVVPYRGEHLRGDALHRQLDAWVRAGIIEPCMAEAVRHVMGHPEWLDLSDRTFVVMGAGAEMGPLTSLCAWGADLALVDLPGADIWQRILTTVRGGAGSARVPVRQKPDGRAPEEDPAEVAGADLITHAPEVLAWLRGLSGPLTIGNYVYADGADNVRVSVAADAVTVALSGDRDDVSVAVLLTPTDVYAAPEEAVEDSQARFRASGRATSLLRRLSGQRLYARNYDSLVTTAEGHRYGIADCLVSQQGPNYALAKRLHRWRARVAREQGTVVSANVAPATRTRSVTKNRVLAAAYAGAPRFGVEVFEPSTSNALMAALLVHDLRHPKAPGNPDVVLPHPLDLFAHQAAHGGMWRNPYAPRSVLTLAAARGLVSRR